MKLLPKELVPWIVVFAPLFSKPVWQSALILLVGAILAPGKRTVSAILRVMGLEHELHFQNYHRVLSTYIRRCISAGASTTLAEPDFSDIALKDTHG